MQPVACALSTSARRLHGVGLEASNSAHRCLATAISKYVFCRDTIVFWCKRARGEESSVDRSEKNLACMGIKKKKKAWMSFS